MFKIETLYYKYKDDIFKYLVSLTNDMQLSEDLLSETFLSAIKSLYTFKNNSDIKTWLFSVARHKWYEYLRKKHNYICLDTLTEIYISENPEEILINKYIAEKILKLLEKESEKNRDILLMRIKGYSFYEISQKYNISENSARVIDFRTKKRIKELLKKENYYE